MHYLCCTSAAQGGKNEPIENVWHSDVADLPRPVDGKRVRARLRERADPFADSSSRTPEYLAINPNGKILGIEEGGLRLWDSMAINLYLAKKHDKDLWLTFRSEFNAPWVGQSPVTSLTLNRLSCWVTAPRTTHPPVGKYLILSVPAGDDGGQIDVQSAYCCQSWTSSLKNFNSRQGPRQSGRGRDGTRDMSGEGALTSDISAHDQGLDLSRSFVSNETFHVAHVAHDVEIERDAVAAEHVTCHPAHFARFDATVIFGQGGHCFFQFAIVDQSTKSDAIELHRGDIAQHVDEH